MVTNINLGKNFLERFFYPNFGDFILTFEKPYKTNQSLKRLRF